MTDEPKAGKASPMRVGMTTPSLQELRAAREAAPAPSAEIAQPQTVNYWFDRLEHAWLGKAGNTFTVDQAARISAVISEMLSAPSADLAAILQPAVDELRHIAERLERYPVGYDMGMSMAHSQFSEELEALAIRLAALLSGRREQ